MIAGVYTFGAPKSGDAAFATAYNARLGSITYRYVNRVAPLEKDFLHTGYDDFVTCLPPANLFNDDGYQHIGRYRTIYEYLDSVGLCTTIQEFDYAHLMSRVPTIDPERHKIVNYDSNLVGGLDNPHSGIPIIFTGWCIFSHVNKNM